MSWAVEEEVSKASGVGQGWAGGFQGLQGGF